MASSASGSNPIVLPGGTSGGDLVKIATVTVGSGGQATIDFASIPATYTHLKICYMTRAVNAGGYLQLRINDDTGTNYERITLQDLHSGGSGTGTVSGSLLTAQTSVLIGDLAPNDQGTPDANAATSGDAEIYAPGSPFHKIGQSRNIFLDGSGSARIFLNGWRWKSTSAITKITLYPSAGGNFVAGSQVTLYGYK